MAPATLEKPKSTPTQPTIAGLPIPMDCELAPDSRQYISDCLGLERRIEAMHESRADVLGCGMRTPLTELWQAGRALEEDRAALEVELAEQLWRRFRLLREMLPDFQQAADDGKAQYESALASEIERLKEIGVSDGLPAARVNPVAADAQLQHLAERAEWVAVTKGAMTRAENALQSLQAQIGVGPGARYGRIEWRPAAPEHALVERVLALQPAPSRPTLDDRLMKFAEQVGLANKCLLPRHVVVLEEIADLLASFSGRVHLDHLSGGLWAKLRPLLDRLPKTRELKPLLENDGAKHTI